MRVECNFCGVEHKQGRYFKQSENHFRKAYNLHGMQPKIRFVEE